MLDAVTFGSAAKDVFLFLKDATLRPGVKGHFLEIPFDKKIDVSETMEFSGGSATNSAATFAKLGKQVSVVSKIGEDANGEFVRRQLLAMGVDTSRLIISEGSTPLTNVIVSTNGHMVIMTYRGVEKTFRAGDIKLDFDTRWVYIGPLPSEAYPMIIEVVNYCQERGIKVALAPGSTELKLGFKGMINLLPKVDLISMNNEEARRFVGYGNDVKNATKLASKVKTAAIVTRGENGSVVADKQYVYHAEAFKAKQINFVGAGDAYFSGFITALMDERKIEEAITLGSANASNVVKHYGAKAGIISEYPDKKLGIRRIEYAKKQA